MEEIQSSTPQARGLPRRRYIWAALSAASAAVLAVGTVLGR
jgi:hypothetical protein